MQQTVFYKYLVVLCIVHTGLKLTAKVNRANAAIQQPHQLIIEVPAGVATFPRIQYFF
jgi:hypothetical protein